jgi:CheY-like chemotaxis protein
MSKKRHILYIEDERPVIELVRTALKLAGYEVVGTTSGEEGVALIQANKPDLLLLDLMMPPPNGWAIYQSLKQDQNLADIPVIVITSKIPEDNPYIIIEDLPPVEDYITKPFDMWRLVRAVQRILG